MSLADLLSTAHCEDNGIFIVVTKNNLHLLRGVIRDDLSSYLKDKRVDDPNAQIIFRRCSNTLVLTVEIYPNCQRQIISESTIACTWGQMIIDAFDNVDSEIIYQGSCFDE